MRGGSGELNQKMALWDCSEDWIWGESQSTLTDYSETGLLSFWEEGHTPESKWPLVVDNQRLVL